MLYTESVHSLTAPEEERDGARAGVAADGGADIVDLHFAVELREAGLDELSHSAGVVQAGGLGDEALAVVIEPLVGKLRHLVHNLADDALFRAHLVARDQAAEIVHVHQRADLQQPAEDRRGLGDAAALDEEAQVGGEKPVVQLQAVFLDPVGQLRCAQPLVALLCGGVHDEAVAGGGAEGVDDVDLALREALHGDVRGVAGGIDGGGDAGGERDVHDVLALLEEGREIVQILLNADLGGLGVGALLHQTVEILEGQALPQIVRIVLAVEDIVEADVMDVDRFKMLLAQIGGGAAAEDIVGHGWISSR